MPILKNHKRLRLASLVATVTATVFASTVSAGGLEPLQRIGRTFGCGWGDGYHACRDSGIRPGADLPPRSFSKQFGNGCLPGSPCASQIGLAGSGSYYDQFDAQFRRRSVGCGGVGCNNLGCDSPGCDSARSVAIDLSPARTYVVGGHARGKIHCDSPGGCAPGCDGQGCDSASFAATWVPTQNVQTQTNATPTTSMPAYSQSETFQQAEASNAQPSDTIGATAPIRPTPIRPTPIRPTPIRPTPIRPAEPASNSDVGPVPSPSKSRELKLPEIGFSENESGGEAKGQDSAEVLPAPAADSIESIPMPTPDPNTDSKQPESANPPMPATLGPLDASVSPDNGLPDGWSEKPVSSNPYANPQGAKPVSLPADVEAALQFPVDNDDDLLLFESAMLTQPRSTSPQRLGAATAAAPRGSKITMPEIPAATPGQPVSFGTQPLTSAAKEQPQRPRVLGRSVPASRFITQPD